MSGLAELGNLWHSIQAWLFPMLEDELPQSIHVTVHGLLEQKAQ